MITSAREIIVCGDLTGEENTCQMESDGAGNMLSVASQDQNYTYTCEEQSLLHNNIDIKQNDSSYYPNSPMQLEDQKSRAITKPNENAVESHERQLLQ
eukprot:15229642-Ditylum_brightwellii.AAC.1